MYKVLVAIFPKNRIIHSTSMPPLTLGKVERLPEVSLYGSSRVKWKYVSYSAVVENA